MRLDSCALAPEGWQRLPIREVCQRITSGGTPSRKCPEFYENGTIGWVKTKELADGFIDQTEELITLKAIAASSAKPLPKDTILLAMYGATVGMLGILSKEMACNQACCALLVKPEFDRDFLFYQLLAHRTQLQGLATGAAQQNLSGQQIKELILPFPNLDEQKAIASVLRSLDDRITLLRETNATLEAIAQAIFKSWFVDFDPVRAKQEGRAPEGMDEATATLFPESFEESELGLVPRGWRVATLGECTTYLNRGISPKYTEDGGVLVLNQKCIRDFAVDATKARRHDAAQRKIEGRELQIGDVLVNSTGVGTLGRVAQLIALDEATIVDSHVTVVRTNTNLTWNYLGLALMRMQPLIEGFGEGTTGQTELSRGKLASIPVVVPLPDVISQFDDAVVPLRTRIAGNQKQAQTLATLRDTLLPRLISGQLRLPDTEDAIAEVVA